MQFILLMKTKYVCPSTVQTILEDEVDDPVYQVGLWAHRADMKHCPV